MKKKLMTIALVCLLALTPFLLVACNSTVNSIPPPTITIPHITVGEFEETIKSTHPVVIYFYRPTCQFCQRQEQHLQNLANTEPKDFDIVRMNMEQATNPAENALFGSLRGEDDAVWGVPAFLIFQNGYELGRFIGLRESKDSLLSAINNILEQ